MRQLRRIRNHLVMRLRRRELHTQEAQFHEKVAGALQNRRVIVAMAAQNHRRMVEQIIAGVLEAAVLAPRHRVSADEVPRIPLRYGKQRVANHLLHAAAVNHKAVGLKVRRVRGHIVDNPLRVQADQHNVALRQRLRRQFAVNCLHQERTAHRVSILVRAINRV